MDFTKGIEDYKKKLINTIENLSNKEINICLNVILDTYNAGGHIYIFGNGGSATTASHFACDFNKGINEYLDKKFNFICLNDNIPTMMAIANDISYDNIFDFQLRGKLKAEDLVIGISGSGNSKNIINAIEYANKEGSKTMGITGYDGGRLKQLAKYSINANIDDMQISEDIHMILDHLMMRVMMEDMFKHIIRLPKQYAEPFIMHYKGYKYSEISEKTNTPLGTIKTRIHKAKALLRKYIKVN